MHRGNIVVDDDVDNKDQSCWKAGNKLEGDVGDIVSLQAQTAPYFQLREDFKCIEHIDKSAPSLKLLPETRKSE